MAQCAPQLDLWLPLYKVSSSGQRRISFSIKQVLKTVQLRAPIGQICEEWCWGILKHLLHIILLQTVLILTVSLIGRENNCSFSGGRLQRLFLLLCWVLFARFVVPWLTDNPVDKMSVTWPLRWKHNEIKSLGKDYSPGWACLYSMQ